MSPGAGAGESGCGGCECGCALYTASGGGTWDTGSLKAACRRRLGTRACASPPVRRRLGMVARTSVSSGRLEARAHAPGRSPATWNAGGAPIHPSPAPHNTDTHQHVPRRPGTQARTHQSVRSHYLDLGNTRQPVAGNLEHRHAPISPSSGDLERGHTTVCPWRLGTRARTPACSRWLGARARTNQPGPDTLQRGDTPARPRRLATRARIHQPVPGDVERGHTAACPRRLGTRARTPACSRRCRARVGKSSSQAPASRNAGRLDPPASGNSKWWPAISSRLRRLETQAATSSPSGV